MGAAHERMSRRSDVCSLPMGLLDDRTVLITGAAGGIGRAMARRFAGEGARLALADRDEAGLNEIVGELDGASGHVVDLVDREAVGRLVDEAVEAHGGLHVVVANAGWTVHGRFADMDLDAIDGVLEVDLRSVLHLVHHALPHLPEGGHIVFTSSMAGFQAFPMQSTYSAAKHGLAGFGDALRMELHGRGVGVTTLMPGAIATDFLHHGETLDSTGDQLAVWLRRYGSPPERVAAAAVRGIRWNRGRVRVGWDAHLVAWVRWLVPWALPGVLRVAMRVRGSR